MSNENKEIMHRWFQEVWNEGRSEVIDELWAQDCIAHGLTDAAGNPLRGPEGFKVFFTKFHDAFPDIQVEIEEIIAEHDRVMARCRASGTHTGDALGFAATGKPIVFEGVAIARIENGQIAEGWNYFDFLGLYQQLEMIEFKAM